MPRFARRGSSAVALAALLTLASCGRACSCIEGEKVFEQFDGPVPMELVRSTHWTGGRLPGPISNFWVRVHTEPAFDEPVNCTKVEFAGDEDGDFVGFRCEGADPWTVLWLRGGDRRVRECGIADAGGRPDFAALGRLADHGDDILACTIEERGDLGATWTELVRAIEEDEGSEAAVAYLTSRIDRDLTSPRGDDVWDVGVAALSEPAAGQVRAAVCDGLARGDTPARAYLRAARRCELDRPAHASVALAGLDHLMAAHRAAVEADPSISHADNSVEFNALEWAAVIAVGTRPEDAGAWACREAERIGTELGSGLRAELLAAMLASTGTACPALDAWLEHVPLCTELLCRGDDGVAPCTAADFEAERADLRRLFESEGQPRVGRAAGDLRESLLAALFVRGELPPVLRTRIARLDYERVATPELPVCSGELPPESPCRCDAHDVSDQLCAIPPGETRGGRPPCVLVVDDDARRVTMLSAVNPQPASPPSQSADPPP